MALDLSKMTPEDHEMIQAGAKSVLARMKGETPATEPEIPAEVQEYLDKNNYTLEGKKPSAIGAVDTATAVRDPAETQLTGIGPQKTPAAPAVIHESTKRVLKDFMIVHAIGLLTQGRDYTYLAEAGLELDVLKSQKSFSREPKEGVTKELMEKRMQQLKDLNLGSEVAGGFFIPTEAHAEWIMKLRGQEIWMNMGVDYLPNSPKYQSWTKEGRDPNIYWPGDTPTDNISTSDMDYGELTLTLKQMACLVQIRLNLIKHALENVEERARNQIIRAMAIEQTKVGLRGTGAKQPLGLFNLPSMTPYTTDINDIPTFNNLLDAMSAIRQRDGVVDAAQSAWVMSESILNVLKKSKTGTAEYNYIMDLTDMPPNRILGLPVYTSSQIRTDLGGTTDESRAMLVGNKKTIMLADGGETEITILKELYARTFQIGLLASKELDFGVQNEQELQFLTSLRTS